MICSRWVGKERLDDKWIKSGYASKAAIDKSSGCRLLEDSYRSRQLTEDIQARLEERDARASKTDEE